MHAKSTLAINSGGISVSAISEASPEDQEENLNSVKSVILHQLEDQIDKLSFPGPADTEAFVRNKIKEYYFLRSGKQKLHWMYKPYKGTTPHIREIFLGRCWDFVQNKANYLVDSKNINCDVLWNSFVKAFANKDPCEVKREDYGEFFSLFDEEPVVDKLALRARGIVHVMLNGTRQHLIDKQIFPAFMDDRERCNSLSIKELQNRLVARGLKTSCYDNPYVFRHLLCLNQPNDPLCLFKTMIPNDD
ncbi:hypothetical protein QZH41_004511 [Actinostola sp. cb2023]|nr:hypothetical protein QZH41_004511 [Actinostola sp. cb2023]